MIHVAKAVIISYQYSIRRSYFNFLLILSINCISSQKTTYNHLTFKGISVLNIEEKHTSLFTNYLFVVFSIQVLI